MHLLHITVYLVVFCGALASANCPVGTFDTWSAWDRCSVSCGGGIQKRQQSLCCPPDAHGQWIDCRATYNITEKFNLEEKPCNQICAHGTYIAGRCSCDPGYNDMCCLTRLPMVPTQIALGYIATKSSTNTVMVTSRPSTNTITAAGATSTYTTAETTAFRTSTTAVTTAPNTTSSITVTTPSSTSTTVTTAPITNSTIVTTEPYTNSNTATIPNTSTTITKVTHSTSTTTAAAEVTIETTRLRVATVNTNSILTITTPDHSSSHQAPNSSLSTYADRKFGDDCTSTTCTALMVCKNLSRGGHHCECKKLGNTDLCVYVLLIILGSIMVGMAAVTSTILVVRKKRKIIPEKADVTEVGETVAIKN